MKDFYIKYRVTILFAAVVVLAWGIYSFVQMQTNLFPDVEFPRITVIADAGEQPSERMMATVTKPIESAAKKVQGVTDVKSITSRGSCTVDLFFRWGTDIYAAKSQLESRINEIKSFLPQGIVVSTEAMNQSLYPVCGFTLKSKIKSRIELRDAADLIVRPMFSQVSGISNVVVRGGKSKEFVVIPDVQKMSRLGVTPAMITEAFNGANVVTGNGHIAAYNRLYLTLSDTRLNNIDDIKRTIIRQAGLRPLHVSDVADVQAEERQDFFKINAAGGDAVLIDLVKQRGVSLVDFSKEATAKAKEIQQQLGSDYELSPYYNQSEFVKDSINGVMRTIYEGLLLAMVVMVLFLRSWRSSAVVLLTIPITIALSTGLMYLAGITLNVMSLGAIAASVGLIIDDAIVIIEQIYRTHEEHRDWDTRRATAESVHYLFPAMIASSLSTIVIFFPFRMMSGLAGSFFKELSVGMELTLAASFLVTWLLLPALHQLFGYKAKSHGDNNTQKIGFLTTLYRKPYVPMLFVLALITMAVLAYGHLRTGFLPELDEGTIVLDYHTPVGTDVDETDRMCKEMERWIMRHPDVQTYSRRTALGMSFDTHPSNYGDYLITLKKNRKKSTPEVISDLRRTISIHVPAVTADFGQRISDLLGDLMSTAKPIEIKIFGNDYTTIGTVAHEAEGVLRTIPGVTDIDDGMVPDGASIVLKPNMDRLWRFGISEQDFNDQVSAHVEGVTMGQNAHVIEPNLAQAAMTGGLQIGSVQEGEQMRRILLRFTDFKSNSPEKLMRSSIFLPDGSTRPLSFFSQMNILTGEMELRRENLKSDITLTARLDGRDLSSTVNDIKQQFNRRIHLPSGCNITFGGAYKEQQQSFDELLKILGIAILSVLTVLMCLLREWKVSFVILGISITGICGSLIALWITGVPLNVSSYTGIIMIVGILTENSIFTVWQYRMNRKDGENVTDSVDYAIALRIRPKIMTAASTILALMPLALGLGVGTQMQQPLSVAVIGGLAAGLPLLLMVLPYMISAIYKERNMTIKQ